jgi:hypothetical protein
VRKAAVLTSSIFFVTWRFGSMSYIAMTAALKVFTRGTLTFLEIIIVVLFIASLAAIAALGWLGHVNGAVRLKFQAYCLIDSILDNDVA